ncbi:hypothetical protein ACWGCI_27130 [Streptomyces sp. NPDC054949]
MVLKDVFEQIRCLSGTFRVLGRILGKKLRLFVLLIARSRALHRALLLQSTGAG